jgi:hypothetical protein
MTAIEVAHADAGLDLLEAVSGLTVYRGKLPPAIATLTPPWVLVYTAVEWPNSGENLNGGLDARSDSCVVTWYCYCAGTTDSSVLAVTGLVRSALLDVRPTIAGRVCDQIGQVSSEPPRPHEATGSSVLTSLAIYELNTRPA